MELAANLNTMGVAAETTETLKELVPKVLDVGGSGTTRPIDWLTMPDVSENEIYLLFHVAPPAENYVAFTVTCTGSYTVEYGTVKDGAFAASGSETITSGTTYEGTFYYDAWADDTSDGKRQVMIKISGTDILTFVQSVHSARNHTSFRAWGIVEFKGNLPSCTSCMVGYTTAVAALQQLRYFSLEGTNKISSFANMFRFCYSLTAILELDTSSGTNFTYMFYYCFTLTAIPEINTSNGTNFTYMFYLCYSLAAVPQLDTSNGASTAYMFGSCYSLTTAPELDTSSSTNISAMFANCYSLALIPALDMSSVSTAATPFTNCYNLKSITFSGTNTAWPADLTFANSSLTATAVEALVNSLPTISTSWAITLTNTPAALTLTSEQIAIATAKNWTVTL